MPSTGMRAGRTKQSAPQHLHPFLHPHHSFFTEKIHIEIESNRILQSQGPDTSGVEVHDPKELLVEAGSVEEDQRRTELQALLLDQGVLTRWEAFKAGTVRRIHT